MADPPKSYLQQLQPELLIEIVNYLENESGPTPQQDLRSWSSTCSQFRSLIAPLLFKSLTLRNTEKTGNSIDLISKGDNRHHVQNLLIYLTAPGDTEDGFADTEGILPKVIEDIISDLGRFPNLESVRVNFEFDFEGEWEDSWELFGDDETSEEILEAEETQAWRALNTKVYAALAKNTTPGFKKLELSALVFKEASSFRTPEFRNLLGHMTHFTSSFWTDDSDSHYRVNVRSGCVGFALKFNELFFDHLSSVTHLTVTADYLPTGVFGSFYHRDSDDVKMPALKSLILESIFINPQLEQFLSNHASTLEVVTLSDCHADQEAYQNAGQNCILWKRLFDALSNKEPTKLREFSVNATEEIELLGDYHATQAQTDNATLALEHLKAHPERRLFAYSYIDDKYGFRGDVQSANIKSFQEGEDQGAFDRLMRIVELNREKS